MKKVFCIVTALTFALMVSARPSAQKTTNYHFGYLSGACGYSSLSQNINTVSTKGGFAYMFGAGYELRVKSFWLSVGGQYQSLESKTIVDTWSPNQVYAGIDTQGRNVNYPYNIQQVDVNKWHTIDIPILAGYYFNGFYVGGGLKAGFSLGSTITTSGTYELIGDYPDYVGQLRDVNYYTTYTQDPIQFDAPLRPQFSILGEIGYDVLSSLPNNSTICNVLKIGFYFEYGLRSVRPNDSMKGLDITSSNVTVATINPYYLSEPTEGKRIVPFFVGLKLTYMLGGSRYGAGTWHKGCQCYGNGK